MEDHRHLTEPRACHFTDILLGPVYAILRQSPVYAILFSQRNHLISYQIQEPITLSDNNSVKKFHVNLMFKHQQQPYCIW